MGSDLSKLKKLSKRVKKTERKCAVKRKKETAQIVANAITQKHHSSKGGAGNGIGSMADLFVESMAGSIAKMGSMSNESDNWNVAKKQIFRGLSVEAQIPIAFIVDIDLVDLFDQLVQSVSKIVPTIITRIWRERLGAAPSAHKWLKIPVESVQSGSETIQVDRIQIAVAIEFLVLQGWNYNKKFNKWTTPTWVSESHTIDSQTLIETIKDTLNDNGMTKVWSHYVPSQAEIDSNHDFLFEDIEQTDHVDAIDIKVHDQMSIDLIQKEAEINQDFDSHHILFVE